MIETTNRLVDHIAGARFADLGPGDVEKAKTFLLDTLGAGIAGSRGEHVSELIDTVRTWGQGDEAAVWVTGERLNAQAAAVVNAYQIHCLEFDCVHEGAVVHPMATVLSTLIAYSERRSAQQRPVNGEEFLLALAIGVDIATFMGIAATGPIRFFRPATAGGLGATAAIARLEGLDHAGIKNALGAMYGQTCGTLQPHLEGSPLLGLQIGFNARGALVALELAKAGFRGPHDIFDGQYGYFAMFEDNQYDLDLIWELMGAEWQISQLSHKPFPSGRLTHGVIDALQKVTEEHGVSSDDIVAITGYVPPLVYRLVGRQDVPHPEPNYAKLCLAYVAGAWMARGQVDLAEFRGRETLSDPAIHAHAAKVDLHLDDNPDQNALCPLRFVFRMSDGRSHEIHLQNVIGHPEAALTAVQNRAKFDRCLTHAIKPLGVSQGAAIADAVEKIEAMDDVAGLARLTLAGQ
ncbi:MmgE/PrpD family protein [Hoeflea sp.]|uniref:MmgE/PrpD family protein n=1 Tax=Hoeflea sp. TaxID=1940281 RepID=UPI003B01B4DA